MHQERDAVCADVLADDCGACAHPFDGARVGDVHCNGAPRRAQVALERRGVVRIMPAVNRKDVQTRVARHGARHRRAGAGRRAEDQRPACVSVRRPFFHRPTPLTRSSRSCTASTTAA